MNAIYFNCQGKKTNEKNTTQNSLKEKKKQKHMLRHRDSDL